MLFFTLLLQIVLSFMILSFSTILQPTLTPGRQPSAHETSSGSERSKRAPIDVNGSPYVSNDPVKLGGQTNANAGRKLPGSFPPIPPSKGSQIASSDAKQQQYLSEGDYMITRVEGDESGGGAGHKDDDEEEVLHINLSNVSSSASLWPEGIKLQPQTARSGSATGELAVSSIYAWLLLHGSNGETIALAWCVLFLFA